MKKTILGVLSFLFFIPALCQDKPDWLTWEKGPEWLNNAVLYQIYPSSYQDSDGNGIGDIPGITSRLDYVASLGVDAIWLSPIFESSWVDGGYDVKDFYCVDPRFGTNDDLFQLVKEAHSRGLKVLLDLVAGHTSYLNPWFLESAQGADYKHSDWFIWTDTLPDEKAKSDLEEMMSSPEPMKNTKGSWMESNSPRARYYNKNFYATQPALNYGYAHPHPDRPWEQPFDAPGPQAVRNEIKNIIAFWFDLGVDGFRVDMAASIIKDDDANFTYAKQFWREVRAWMDEKYPEHILMAEWGGPKNCLAAGFNVDMDLTGRGSVTRRIYQDEKKQANGGAYFSLNAGAPSTYDLYGNKWAPELIDTTSAQTMLYSWMDRTYDEFITTSDWGYYATITGNHDQFRMNMGDRNDVKQLKVMMSFILTMPLPIIYYGEEIGMRSLADLPSVEGSNHNGHERSGARTPMQWDNGNNAGFSTCSQDSLYLPICPEWTPATSYPQYLDWKSRKRKTHTSKGAITVASQDNDQASLLNYTKRLIAFRKTHPAFSSSGTWIPVKTPGHPYPMVYKRALDSEEYLVILNPTGSKVRIQGTEGSIVWKEGRCRESKNETIIWPTSVVIKKL